MLRFNTLGRLYVTRDGRRLTGAAAQPRRLALLAILAAAGDRGVSRERVLALLWADTEEERARKGLNQALYALRQELGSDEAIVGTRDLVLDPAIVSCDVMRFRSALARGEPEVAVDEYAGPFLDGFHLGGASEFEHWLEAERGSLARDHATALERLARRADEQGDAAGAIEWLRRLAAHDPLDARTAIRLMEALARAGESAAALQHARVYELLVQQEIDAPPDAQVVALAERIRREMVRAPATPPPAPEPAAVTPVSEPEPVEILDEESAVEVPAPAMFVAEPTPLASTAIGAMTPPASVVAAVAPPSRWGIYLSLALIGAAAVVVVARFIPSRAGQNVPVLGATQKLTLDPGLEVDASPSPDGRVVAYAAGPEGAMRLFVRQVDGGRAVQITTDLPGDHRRPRWSPDGARLLFQAGGSIWIVPSLGGVPRTVVEPGGNGGRALYPTWSPDGRSVAWVDRDTIRARPIDGGATRLVAVLHDSHSLAWSPDGRWIAAVQGNAEFLYGAVSMYPGQTSIGNAAPSSVWLLPADGQGAPVRVTDGEHLHTSPEWLAARRLAFVSDREGSRDVFLANLGDDGQPRGDPVRLTTGLGALSIGLSEDGRTMAYAHFTQRANIWALPIPATGTIGTASARPVTSGAQVVEGLDVSPDGHWLAFDADRSGHQELFRVPTDCVTRLGAVSGDSACGEPERLAEGAKEGFRPSWLPDGRGVVFYTFERGTRHAFVASAQGASARPLLPASWGEVHSPVVSPDARHLTFHRDLASGSQLFESSRVRDSAWSAPRQLTQHGGWGARWSPDGTRLVYLAPGEVRAMGASGESDSRLLYAATAGHPVPVWLRWATDGRTLYVKAFDATGAASLLAVPAGCAPSGDAGCGAPRTLVRFDEPGRPARRPEFATDGARFYFTLAERESDLWIVRLSPR